MKIIVVEDDATIGSLLLRGLSAEGLAVDWLTSIRTARPPLLAGTHDAAILDLGLPDGDGLDLCRELRAAGSEIPILMLTARTSIDDKLDGFRCGADDYLAKPFSFAELLARLNAMLRRQAPLRAMRLAVGDLRIDAISHVARIGERPLDLTRREFALLHVLARHQGRPVSRAQLLDAPAFRPRVRAGTGDRAGHWLHAARSALRRHAQIIVPRPGAVEMTTLPACSSAVRNNPIGCRDYQRTSADALSVRGCPG